MRPAYDAIEAWIIDQGGQPEGPAWEIYYTDPNEEPDPSNWRTEIVQPYRVL
jgi:effector-binding domain-containing protein